jgi:putative redox protein
MGAQQASLDPGGQGVLDGPRRLPMPDAHTSHEGKVVITQAGENVFAHLMQAGPHQVRLDEPVSWGGTDTGPTPYDLLLGALGGCTAMTLRLYAQRKGWPLERVEVRLSHSRIHARDCEDCETKEGRIDVLDREIVLVGPLEDEQRKRLLQIADRCPVHQTLGGEMKVRSRLVEDEKIESDAQR